MKDLMKTIDDLRVASGAVDEKQAVQAIVKYASGQGEENLANLTRLTQHLSDDNKAVLEMNILQDIFNKSFFADKEVDIKVFDSAAFLDKLATLTGKDGQKAVFQSKAAKEFLKMVDDFHTLFKKDADIARRISPARSNNPFGNSNFATTASGKLAMLRIKLLFEVAMRNMPDVFWLPANWTNAFKSAALKYHLEHALTRSNTISEFKTNFTHNVKRSQHTPQTQRLIKQITQGLDGLEKDAQELAKMSDDELALRALFGENYAEFKGKGQEAINHLLETKSGQVQGAFHRDDLGEINLVWGQVTDAKKHKGYGLAHIVDKHGEQAARQIPQIIKDGKLAKDTQGRLRIETQSHIVGINDTYGDEKIGHWIVTSYEKKGDGVSSSTSSPITTPKVQGENPLNEIIPNSNSQSQAPQKSLLEQARENTERLRAEQEAAQIAQKEAELARLKEMQAKNAEILAQKEAAAGQAINEAQSLEIGTPIKAQKISDTKIIINDNTPPFKAEFIIAKKDDIKPNFERTGTQGRSERQDKVIESIQSDFKPHLIFEQMGGFEGLPIILKDGQVIAGNHRAQAIKGLTGENLARYKQAAKEKFGVDLKDDEVIVRLVKDGDEKELINLAFMSNVGRESNLGEKALANLAKYDSQIQALPSRINADSVFELESQVAKALDTQGNGLNVFDTNLALFSRLAKSTQNANILDSLNALKNLSQDEKEKVLRMFVSNAGEFHNLAKDTELKSLNLNDYLADALIVAAKNVDSTTRAANYAKLLDDIITIQASAKEQLKIDPFLFENFKSKALGYALARFARLENPSAKLFEFLKASKADLENLYTGNIFESNKAISDIDIYDFLKHAINSGEDLIDKQGRNIKGEITSRLDDLRKVENALIDSGEIQFAKSKAKPKTIKFIDNFTQNSALFKTLDNEKQQAILKIKEIEAEKMPDNLMNLGDFENLQVHFSGKADEAQRQKYAPLFDITTQKPDIKLKTSKDGQERTEYIKAFQHKESKDMFYIAITQENDKIKITGIPTTQISKVVNDIIKSEKVLKAGNFETISNPAELNKVSTLNDIIPKIANKFNKDEIWAKNLYEWHKDSSPLTKEADGTPKVFYHGSNTPDITIFGNDYSGIGFWFSDDKQYANYFKSQIGGKTYEVFLNTKNPLDLSKDIDLKELKQIFGDEIEKFAGVSEETLKELENPVKIFMPHNQSYADDAFKYAQKIQDAGYDGIIGKDNANNPYFVVFNPNQIKSIDNTGKFDNTNDNILFALGKAKPQGREAKETSINSLFADDELQMQATKPAKELNLSDEKDFNELGEFFKLNLKDKEFNEIYDKAAQAAQRLGVKVRFDESAARSHFVLNDNTITIAAANKEHFQAQDLLHELIHATTRKALKDFSFNPEQAAKIYTKRQIEAINEINSLYLKSKGIAKRQGKDAYALQNVDEFVAELSSGEFRAFLKAQDIFERFIKALIRFFTGDSEKLAKNVNSYKALKESYYKILDDYEPPLVEKSVLDKNSEPQLAPNLSSDEILANSKAKSQVSNKQQVREFYSQINALRKEQKDKIAQAKNEFDTADKEMTPARYKSNLINTMKNEVKKIDDELGFDHSAYHTTKNDLRVGKNGVVKMVKVKRVAFSFNDLAHARKSIDLMKENLTNDEFKEARQYFQRVIDKVEPLLKSVDDIESAKAKLTQDLDTKISTIKKEFDDKITRLKESFANTPQEIKDERTRAIITNLKTNAKEFSYIDKDALAKAELEGYGEVISDERLARDLRRLSALREQIEQGTNTTPLKEFGTNYAEFYRDGQGAVKKLLAEKQGQVAGAFYRDDLAKATGTGEIDLVWGDSTKGLQHILERRAADFETQGLTKEQATQKALEFVENDLNEIFQNGKATIQDNRAVIDTGDKMGIIALDYFGKDRKWIITAYNKYNASPSHSAGFAQNETLSHSNQLTSAKTGLDNVNSSENLGKSQGTAEIQKRSVQDYVDEFEQTFSSKIDEMNSHSFYNGGANVVKRFKENVETIKEMNLPLLAEQTAINKLFKLYTKQMNSWYPSMMSVGGANYNVKKGEKSFEIWGKTSSEISELMENLKDTSKKIVQSESDIYSDEFVKIAPFALATGAQRIGISFNTKPSVKMIFALKKKGAIWNSLEQVWSFKPERFEQAKEWLENSFYELATGEKKILNLSKEIQEVKPRIESFKDEQKRLAKEYKEQQATKNAEIDDLQTQERIAKRKLADIKDSVKTTQEAIKRHESADSTSWMLPELKKQLELHKKDAQSAQQTLENIQQKIKELNSLDLSYAPKRNADEITTKIQEKFKFDEKKAKDLYEWHKDSSPLTKNDDGTPKVFYHGAKVAKGADIEIFDTKFANGNYEHGQIKNLPFGFFFSSDLKTAKGYTYNDNELVKNVFLKLENPLVIDFGGKTYNQGIDDAISQMSQEFKKGTHDSIIYKNIIDDSTQDRAKKHKVADTIIVFDSKQIKSIDNAGSWTDSAGKITKEKPSDESARHSYFNAQSPNILHSNEIWGGGLAGGTLNGLETDENGNIIGFDPAKFVAGFIAGAAGTRAVKLALQKNPNIRAKAERFVAQSGEFIKNELQNSDLPRHARHALENALGKNLVKMLDGRLWIVEPQQAVTTLKRRTKNLIAQEQLALKGVVYNGDKAALIYKDLEQIDEAILLQKGNKNKGGKHIRLEHTQDEAQLGFVTPDEVANIGQNVRKYINEYGKPFEDSYTGRVYEWQDENGVKFRLVVKNLKEVGSGNSNLPSANEEIIIFYSNRNLKDDTKKHISKKEWFKNPAVAERYKEKMYYGGYTEYGISGNAYNDMRYKGTRPLQYFTQDDLNFLKKN